MMTSEQGTRKRGRKAKDPTDVRIEESRRTVLRGIPHILQRGGSGDLGEALRSQFDHSNDELTRAILARELEITKKRELVEIRPMLVSDETLGVGGSPVSTRLSLPTQSVGKCLTNAVGQVAHFQSSIGDECSTTAFTPESYILLSKACEQMVVELAARAYVNSVESGSAGVVTGHHLADGVRSAWKSRGREYSAMGAFDFLIDVFDRHDADETFDRLDAVAKIHRTT